MSIRKTLSSLVCLLLFSVPAIAKGDAASADFTEDKDGENALDLEDYARAESLFRTDLKGKPSGAQEGYYRTGLGESLLWQGKFSDANKEFKRAFGLIDKTQPAASDLRARVLDDIAYQNETQNDRAGAIASDKQALAALHGLNTTAIPVHLCGVLEHLGSLCKDAGQYAESLGYYREAITVTAQYYSPQSIQLADAKESAAAVARMLGNTDEAARLYNEAMQVKWNSPAMFSNYTPHIYSDTVTYHFYIGAPNCSRDNRIGRDIEAINIRGVTVSACINASSKELGKTGSATVSVMNETQYPLQVLPKSPELLVLAPRVVISHIVNPSTLASTVQKKGEKSAKWVRFWGKDSTTPVTTTFVGYPGVWGYPPITTYNYQPPMITRNGNITTMTTQVPDYAAQARALQKAAELEDRAREQAAKIRDSTLGASTVQPGGTVSGTVYFDTADIQKAILDIPIGNAMFEFKFPPDS